MKQGKGVVETTAMGRFHLFPLPSSERCYNGDSANFDDWERAHMAILINIECSFPLFSERSEVEVDVKVFN